MRKYYYFFLIVFSSLWSFAQQSTEFLEVKGYFDRHRASLVQAFKEELIETRSARNKQETQAEFMEFMIKLDSIQNVAAINALVGVKTREALKALHSAHQKPPRRIKKGNGEVPASYEGGVKKLQKEVGELFYFDAFLDQPTQLSAEISFIVEEDGSISNVEANGENPVFNRQAEIAIYMLPGKFSPAEVNGAPVRYRFRLPLKMNFE